MNTKWISNVQIPWKFEGALQLIHCIQKWHNLNDFHLAKYILLDLDDLKLNNEYLTYVSRTPFPDLNSTDHALTSAKQNW